MFRLAGAWQDVQHQDEREQDREAAHDARDGAAGDRLDGVSDNRRHDED